MLINKTVLISGANGYFGQVACQFFSQNGWTVLKATRDHQADVYFDLNYPHQFLNQKLKQDVHVFIHAAAAHEVNCRQYPYESISQNILGTKAALDFCVQNGIKHFIYLSTFHVFGHPNGDIDEKTLPQPINDYGMSHLQAEEYVNMYHRNGLVKGYVIRPTNFFGVPSDISKFNRWTLVPFAFCKEALEYHQIKLTTPGLQLRNFISVYDICQVIYELIEKEHDIPLLHLPGPNTLSIRNFALLVKKQSSKHLNLDIDVIVPSTTQKSTNTEIFSYKSLYLSNVYEPKDCISDFVVQFLILLNSNKKN